MAHRVYAPPGLESPDALTAAMTVHLAYPFRSDWMHRPYTVKDVYGAIDSYMDARHRLRVRRVAMGSPGLLTFEGLGEVMEQLRQLIKDLWYRNSQEKALGRLEIIEKCLQVRVEHKLPLHPVERASEREMVEIVSDELHNLKELEDSGKLLAIPDHIDDAE